MQVNQITLDLDGVRLNPLLNSYEDAIKQYLVQTCKAIKMNPLYGPVVCKGSDHNPGETGFLVGFMVIDTSHISVHYFSKCAKMRIDVYSCKPFYHDIPIGMAEIYFPSDTHRLQIVERRPV